MPPRTKKSEKKGEKEKVEKPKRAARKTTVRKTKKETKETIETVAARETASPAEKQEEKREFIYAVGRRKSAVARVRLFPQGTGAFVVNKKSIEAYFSTWEAQKIVREPLNSLGIQGIYDINVLAQGGGASSQAEAIRLGVARALVKFNQDFKKTMRACGFLTRDPRVKERKKPGLKRARRAPQWQKR